MKAKHPELLRELMSRPQKLQKIARDFETLSMMFDIEPVITRVLEKIDGSSGVHEDGRGVDFRNEHDGTFLYNLDEAEALCSFINALHPREDKYKVLIHHSFKGGTNHFHMQIPFAWV